MEEIKLSQNRWIMRLIGDDWSIIVIQADSIESAYQKAVADGIQPSQIATVSGPNGRDYPDYGEVSHL